MNRVFFYLLYYFAVLSKLYSPKTYDKWIVKAHRRAGVRFVGTPEYIDPKAHLDASGGLTIWGGRFYPLTSSFLPTIGASCEG